MAHFNWLQQIPGVTHENVHVYLTLRRTFRAYIPGLRVDAWGSFRSTAIRKMIDNLQATNIPFDFSNAPESFWGKPIDE